ncbi:MAG: MoaD/ThiS family protein, partial [Candidatus Odinarchaeota archaeon]|nr:MoaD/ThiS family protein [Candidatus Odinarchaeota archaeon]
IIVLINGRPATLETEVKDSDQIVVMPVIGGG